MKKFLSRFSLILCLILMVNVFVSCSFDDGDVEKEDPNKTQLYVGLYNGGLGNEWIREIKRAFEAKYPTVQVMIDLGKDNFDSSLVYNNYNSYRQDIFFMDYCSDAQLNSYIKSGYIAEISDIIDEPLTEFGEDESIYDKITPFLKNYYYKDGKAYALPWYQSSYQMVYDVTLFRNESLYKDEDGNWNDGSNKHAGQDGVKGTYDDGLPVTMADFFELLNYMKDQKGITPLVWTGINEYYFTSFLTNVYANYAGYDDFLLNATLSGNHSTLGEISLENGWILKGNQPGQQFALQFAWDIVTGGYFYKDTFGTYQDHTKAQDDFVGSMFTNKPIAMIIEGTWWEREAKGTMDSFAVFGEEFAYGTREYGIMPIPLDNNGNSKGDTIASTSGRSIVFINNRTKNLDIAKNFLKFITTDEMLQVATAYSNTPRPYIYEMEQGYLSLMTPYGRSIWDFYNNKKVIFDEVPLNSFLQSTRGYGSKGSDYIGYLYHFKSIIDGKTYIDPATAFNNRFDNGMTVAKYIEGLKNKESEWSAALTAYLS